MRKSKSAKVKARTRRWRLNLPVFIAALVAFVGVTMYLYPEAASWVNQLNQSQATDNYAQENLAADPPGAEQIALAKRYNKALNMGVLLGSHERIPESTGTQNSDLDYWKMLRVTDDAPMARLRIEAIDVDLPVYHGTSDETLLRGAGHLEGSSLPVGGAGTHTVVTAHRGLAEATMFNNLPDLEVGDRFSFEVFNEVYVYEVFSKRTVEPEDTDSLRPEGDRDLATLVTCSPLGVNTHRMLVTGERVFPTPQEDIAKVGEPSELPRFPWWAVLYVLAIILLGLMVWRLGYPAKKSNKTLPSRASANPGSDRPGDPAPPARRAE